MSKRLIKIILLIQILLLVACQASTKTTLPTLRMAVSSSFLTSTPTQTTTPLPPTMAAVLTSTPLDDDMFALTPTPGNPLNQKMGCPAAPLVSPEDIHLNGTLILQDLTLNGAPKGVFSWFDLQTGMITPIALQNDRSFYAYQVAPDRKKIMYFEIEPGNDSRKKKRWLVIADRNGNILSKNQDNLMVWDGSYWLDENRVVIRIDEQIFVQNITTGYEEFSIGDWFSKDPDIGYLGGSYMTTWGASVVPNSTLDRIFFIQEDSTLVLFDLISGKVLKKLSSDPGYLPQNRPIWSSDSSEVIFSYLTPEATSKDQEELYSLSRDGEMQRLTFLTESYHSIAILHFSLSPDERQIAFFFLDLSEAEHQAQLGILDRESGRVRIYCHLSGYAVIPMAPIWSPDGEKLLISSQNKDKTWKLILFDTVKGYAAEIYQGGEATGWLLDPKEP